MGVLLCKKLFTQPGFGRTITFTKVKTSKQTNKFKTYGQNMKMSEFTLRPH